MRLLTQPQSHKSTPRQHEHHTPTSYPGLESHRTSPPYTDNGAMVNLLLLIAHRVYPLSSHLQTQCIMHIHTSQHPFLCIHFIDVALHITPPTDQPNTSVHDQSETCDSYGTIVPTSNHTRTKTQTTIQVSRKRSANLCTRTVPLAYHDMTNAFMQLCLCS